MKCNLAEARPEDAVTSEDMRATEINSIWWGFDLERAMENAGRAVADAVECYLGNVKGKSVIVYAGKGGNGGDGVVAARHLASRGARVSVHLLWDPQLASHQATQKNLRYLLLSKAVRVLPPYSKGWLEEREADVVIDAVLGVGVRGPLRSPVREALMAFNNSSGLRVAVDIPSGLDPNTGAVAEGAAIADLTVTMHRPKRGLFLNRGPLHAGRVVVADLGFPPEAQTYAGPGDVEARIPLRPKEAYKGLGGKVLVIGGSAEYVGAPIISARAAALAGADLVYIAAPREISLGAALSSPHLVPIARGKPEEFKALLEKLGEKVHSVVLGPGLGYTDETEALVEYVVEALRGKALVIDADALKVVARRGLPLGKQAILTPHRGEAGMLLGEKIDPLAADSLALAKRVAEKYGATAVVKAPVDAVCSPEGMCRLNRTGHPSMATGGTGDMLAGIIAAFMARREALSLPPDPLNATAAALYVSGRAGELAAEELGENLTSLEVVEKIPMAIKEARELVGAAPG
ncbi:MAG: NAD(P)H-hydrate dehydratase [Acidilobaceae archaeon]|nr:NAD(P)H-hydrate dehydratase [Acidilobaceae archaeon]MCX8166012.1 NAD(P)H-hydrate dehydratase [Acidilobaceae archaeon]MDW7974653.1 NAD(P)H-hydrate dehydratase [Sulfolobales archaeon]